MRKNQKNKIYLSIIALVSVVAISGAVFAFTGNTNTVIENAEKVVVEGNAAEQFGAIPGTEYYEKVHFNDGIFAAGSYTFDLNFQAGTSTGQTSVEATESYLGGVQNTSGGDLLCSAVYSDVDTATGLFAYDIKVGEATSATSSGTLIKAITGGHEIGTSTTDVLNKQDDEGTNTDEVFVWDENNYITATQIFNTTNATSSASFTAAGGNDGDGTVSIDCLKR